MIYALRPVLEVNAESGNGPTITFNLEIKSYLYVNGPKVMKNDSGQISFDRRLNKKSVLIFVLNPTLNSSLKM